MATKKTTTPETPDERPTLMDIAHRQVDALSDIQALQATEQAGGSPGEPLTELEAGNVRRLARITNERVGDVIAAFSEHI